MRICFVTSYKPNKANLAEYGEELTNALSKSPLIKKIFIIGDVNKVAKKEEKINNKIEVMRCWKNNSLLIPLQILFNLRKIDADAIIFNLHLMSWGRSKYVNFLGAITPFLTKKLFKKRVIVILHNIGEAIDLNEIGSITPNKLNLFGLSIATRFLLSVDRVSVLVKRYVKILEEKYKRKNIVHIPHGTLGAKIGKPTVGGKTILTIGHWSKKKNLPFLIKAFKEINKEDEELKLIVVGESHPNFPGYLEKIKKDFPLENIEYVRYIPHQNLRQLILSSTAVVLPYSTTTGSSGALHLAVSFGKPIITTDLLDFRDLAENEKFSIVMVPKNNMEILKREIKRIVNDKKQQEIMGKINLKYADKFSFNYVAEKYIEILSQY